jgi:transcriptional regulator
LPKARMNSTMQTVRQQMVSLLLEGSRSALELSGLLRIPHKEVFEHLEHIRLSLSSQSRTFLIDPARCLECQYLFRDRRRLASPSRCPRCRSEHIQDPKYRIATPRKLSKKQDHK